MKIHFKVKIPLKKELKDFSYIYQNKINVWSMAQIKTINLLFKYFLKTKTRNYRKSLKFSLQLFKIIEKQIRLFHRTKLLWTFRQNSKRREWQRRNGHPSFPKLRSENPVLYYSQFFNDKGFAKWLKEFRLIFLLKTFAYPNIHIFVRQ